MTDSLFRALVGDSCAERAELLAGILRQECAARPVIASTFEELTDQYSRHPRWDYLLIADDLPFSQSLPQNMLPSYIGDVPPSMRASVTGWVVERSTIHQNLDPFPCIRRDSLEVPKNIDAADVERITQFLRTRIPRLSPGTIVLDSPPGNADARMILEEQLRNLSCERNLRQAKDIVADAVARFRPWRTVHVGTMGQGRSGSVVFRVSPSPGARVSHVLKLYPLGSKWKAIKEVQGTFDAASTLATEGRRYTSHIPELQPLLIPPRSGSEREDSFVVNVASNWVAICYHFLGEDGLGDFADIEELLLASPQTIETRLSGKAYGRALKSEASSTTQWADAALRRTVRWLCSRWYADPTQLSRRGIGSTPPVLWTPDDAPERDYPPRPPYRLRGSTKGYILQFLNDSTTRRIGARLLGQVVWGGMSTQLREFLAAESTTGINALDRDLEVILGPAHGDLNFGNLRLWLEKDDHPFLLDFPFFQKEGHAVQDLARFEVEILFSVLDRQRWIPDTSLPAYDDTPRQFPVWRIVADKLLESEHLPENVEIEVSRFRRGGRAAWRMLRIVREASIEIQSQLAEPAMGCPGFWEEYLPPLLYWSIQAIGYPSLPLAKRLLAVYVSGTILRKLNDLTPSDYSGG